MRKIIKNNNAFSLKGAHSTHVYRSYIYRKEKKDTDPTMQMKFLSGKKHRTIICFLFANMSLGKINEEINYE